MIRKNGKLDAMNGEKISFSEDGTKISENYKNGLLDGERTFYFPNGAVKRKENYRAGRLNGLASDFNEEGKLIHSSTHSYHWKYGMEKWYNSEGKMVKSMQWQRDLPVGTEKQTFNGILVESMPYVKGVKQGLAKVPVYFEEVVDSVNTEPLGIETVNYQNDQKSGKAICFRFGSNDTLYVANYKAGKLDSTYIWYQQSMHSYYKNVPRFTKNYVNGLEHGTCIYRITAGPLKDSIYQTESYSNGKLDGLVVQYYKKNADQSPEFVPGEWYSNYSFETYQMGVQNGPFLFREDSVNYSKGTYFNGRLEELYETGTVLGGKRIKSTGSYQNGLKTGEWTTEYLPDGIVVTEHFERNIKQGGFSKTVKGFKTEERFYSQDTLKHLIFFDENGSSRSFVIDFRNNRDTVLIKYEIKEPAKSSSFSYLFDVRDYPKQNTDTILLTIASSFSTNNQIGRHLNGPFTITTPNYEVYGNFKDSKWDGKIEITHFKESIFERLTYQNGQQISSVYTQIVICTDEPYTGTFISALNGEKISVKNGLRHGWCIEYDSEGKKIVKEKYVKGIAKKRVSDESLPPPESIN
ncbi:toxin-antitoxin system YwqK family antitoxin [Fluviicola sp.]|uniref:toxin-antitoxin system YwqK family antitoxin n=1 Tax=Fluviicola sp. TaxID=1917219 RepID=UPI003D27EA13